MRMKRILKQFSPAAQSPSSLAGCPTGRVGSVGAGGDRAVRSDGQAGSMSYGKRDFLQPFVNSLEEGRATAEKCRLFETGLLGKDQSFVFESRNSEVPLYSSSAESVAIDNFCIPKIVTKERFTGCRKCSSGASFCGQKKNLKAGGTPAVRDRADFRACRARLHRTSDLRPLSSDLCPPTSVLRPRSRYAANAGFSLIEVMVSAVLAVIVVWAAGTQIINVLRYHNEYRIDAILLEDLTRVANGVQSRIEMCTNWVASASGGWEGGFPIQINGVAFETNRFTNVTKYRIYTEDSAFVEELIRKPAGNEVTNTIRRFIATEPGFSSVTTEVFFKTNNVDLVYEATPYPLIEITRAEFSASAEWRWAGRTYTNRVTVPRIIVLYNKN
jgi:prepilin-type N-terminal cleavage/methylation domain-containing protein